MALTVEHIRKRGDEATWIGARLWELTTASVHNAFGEKRAVHRGALDINAEQNLGDRAGRFIASTAVTAAALSANWNMSHEAFDAQGRMDHPQAMRTARRVDK
ncbi:hypothetical protein [Rhizobium sp. SL86]|uniref:hypothetical protein n=1 Tax=Rhizobium sp. SL86 TaxID=2995148 RepID=UPI0022761DD8|nr:hypothetical protein [Rhizobium sp. SL86]MCY1666683.1 hypothetical protein [Rhizobium sp. SL86]